MSPHTVLVLGAAGRFGHAAVQAFAQAGWRVLAQQRRPPAQPSAGPVQTLPLPLSQPDALAAAARGASVVVHAANPVYTRWDAELLPLLHQGLAVCERLGARFVLPGNVYAYGRQMPPRLDESTPARPDTDKGRLRARMEDELQRRAGRGLDSVVLRAGDFFGSGRGSWLDLLIARSLPRGRLAYPGPLDRVHAWAYLPDLARAAVAVAGDGGYRGCLRLHFEGHAVTGQAYVDALAQAAASLGLRPDGGWRIGGVPWPLIRALGLVHPMMRELGRMSYLWQVPHALDGTTLRQRVGPLAQTPLVDALRQSLAALLPDEGAAVRQGIKAPAR